MTTDHRERLLSGLVAVVATALFFGVRWQFMTGEAATWGLNSDTAIFGLMARELVEGEGFPMFFWGQNYMGPLTSWVTAAVSVVFSWFGVSEPVLGFPADTYVVPPTALRLVASVQMFLGNILFWAASRRLFGSRTAAGLLILLCYWGPPVIFRNSLRPLGAEAAYFLGALILYLFVRNIFDSLRGKFALGLLIGFSWWINQTIVFVLLPILFYWLAPTEMYRKVRSWAWIVDSVLLRRYPEFRGKSALQALNGLLVLVSVSGIAIAAMGGLRTEVFGVSLKIPDGISTMRDGVLGLVLVQAILALYFGTVSLRRAWKSFPEVRYLLAGAALGYSPVILGWIFDWYPKSFGASFKLLSIEQLIPHLLQTVPGAIPEWLGSLPGHENAVLIFALVTLGAFVWLNRAQVFSYVVLKSRRYPKESVFWGILFFSFLYFLVGHRNESGPIRYLILALPVAYGGLMVGLESIWTRWKQGWLPATALFAALLFYLSNLGATQAEWVRDQRFSGSAIEAIRDAGYSLCVASYWDSYRLEYLSDKNLRFIPMTGERVPGVSRARRLEPGPKCAYLGDGQVLPLSGE